MKKNDFAFFSLAVFWFIGMTTKWPLWAAILVIINALLVLSNVVYRVWSWKHEA